MAIDTEEYEEGQPHQVSNRLQFFPIMMFAISMGLGGITIAWQKAAEMLGTPHYIGQYLLYAETAVFAVISLTYLIKLLIYPHEVIEEWHHPVRINFFAAISITLLMLAIIYKPEYKTAALYVWAAGTILHTYLTLYTISRWINHNQEINHSNPAWFIPIVGNLLVPVGGIGFVSNHILMYYFSVGLFFWLILFAVLINHFPPSIAPEIHANAVYFPRTSGRCLYRIFQAQPWPRQLRHDSFQHLRLFLADVGVHVSQLHRIEVFHLLVGICFPRCCHGNRNNGGLSCHQRYYNALRIVCITSHSHTGDLRGLFLHGQMLTQR